MIGDIVYSDNDLPGIYNSSLVVGLGSIHYWLHCPVGWLAGLDDWLGMHQPIRIGGFFVTGHF